MQRHWVEVAPPAYITSAAAVDYRPTTAPEEGGGDFIEDPEQLAIALSSLPGGTFD